MTKNGQGHLVNYRIGRGGLYLKTRPWLQKVMKNEYSYHSKVVSFTGQVI